ncbi:phytoene desaturase family protein [Chloroflexota bacterium]
MAKGKYDVVVIGSGMGGLCSTSLLALYGYKVLCVESLGRPGGRFSTDEFDGFKLPTGGIGIECRAMVQGVFEEVGAKFDVEDISRHFVWWKGSWIELPERGQMRFLLSLAGCTPTQVDKIGSAFRDLKRYYDVYKTENPMSFREWLLQYTTNDDALQAFHVITSAMSELNDFEYPAFHWGEYTSAEGQGGLTYLGLSRKGNRSNAENMVDAIKAKGGEIWLDSPVKQIIIKDNKVTGVLVEKDGKDIEVEANAFISNTGPKRTVQLAGRNNFDADYLSKADGLKEVPLVVSIIASEKLLIDVPGSVIPLGMRRIVDGHQITRFCPDWAPPGQHLLILWGTPINCDHPMDVDKEIEANIQDIKDFAPDFEKYGRILKMDLRDVGDEFPGYRAWPGYTIVQQTPFANLFNVGDAVMPSGWEGFAGCAKSARVAVDLIKKGFPPEKT